MKLQTLTLLLIAIIFASSFIISTESTTIKTDNRILKPDETTQQQEDTQTRSTNTGQDKGQADFLNQIEEIDEEAQEGVHAEEDKLEKEAKVEMQIEKLKADTKAEKVREAKQERMDDKAMQTLVTRALGMKQMFPSVAKQVIKSWKTPIDYMIDPNPKKMEWKQISDRNKLYDRSYKTPVEGVLVTIYNPKPDRFFTVWDYNRVARAIHAIGVTDNIPLDKETRCFCKLVAMPNMHNHPACICTHPTMKLPQRKLPNGGGGGKSALHKLILAASEEETKRHKEQSTKRVAESKNKKQMEIDRRIYLLNKRLTQHQDGVEGKRELRLKDELNALDNYGTTFTLQDIRSKRLKFNNTDGNTVATPKPKGAQVKSIQNVESDTRLMISSLTMQRYEIISRIKEYSRLNRMAHDDLKAANETSALFATVVHKNALKKLNHFMKEMNPFNFSTTMKYMEETKTLIPYNGSSQKLSHNLEEKYKKAKAEQLPKLLEEMDTETREVLMYWLVRKSKDSFAEQENKTNARLDHDQFELDQREEEWRKANETRADILRNMEMNDEEYRKLEAHVKKQQEEIVKSQIRLNHEEHVFNAEQTRKEEYQKQREHEVAVTEEELHKKYVRAEEEIKRNEEMRKRAAILAARKREEGLKKRYRGVSLDITAQLNRLKIMHSKLEEGRKTLEREEERRKQKGPGGEEDELCALCKKEDEIFKLETEIVKIDRRMKAPTCVKQPGCKESLKFEIDRLKQEVDRRRALLMEMVREAESDRDALREFIDDCPNKPNGGCSKQLEWQKRLQLKKIEDMLHRMNKREAERALIKIYKCLYEHREAKSLEHPIDTMFGVPYKMNEDALKATKNGCSALQMSATKNEDAKPLHKCICGGDENAEKLAETLGKTMNKRVAKQKLDQATKNYRDKKKAEEKAEKQEEAKEIEKDVIAEVIPFHPEVVKQGGSVDDVAKRAIAIAKTTPGVDLKKIHDESVRRVEERHVGRKKDCPKGNNCDKLNKAEKVNSDLLNKCLKNVNSDAIRANLRRAFQAGTKATGCALLSLASNPLLQETHKCVCE